jgi:hypothetical protein
MSHPLELTFENAIGTYNALWDLSGRIATDPRIGNPQNWVLTFREGLRGMLARLVAVDREYLKLHQFQSQADNAGNPNEWGLICESHAGVILFGMDSAIECFVFAMNAIGFLKTPTDFCDIGDAKTLWQIGPKNILGRDPTDKRNPKPGYLKVFPRVVACWQKHQTLLSAIFEYHDVSKHRSAVATGGNVGVLHLRGDPKQPGSMMSSTVYTLETLSHDFQKFIDELLPIALDETAQAFGYTTMKKKDVSG